MFRCCKIILEYCSLFYLFLFAFVLLEPYLFCSLLVKKILSSFYEFSIPHQIFLFFVLYQIELQKHRGLETSSSSSIAKCLWGRRTMPYYCSRKVLFNARGMGKTECVTYRVFVLQFW